jgi:protein-tyrosine-phosphatase
MPRPLIFPQKPAKAMPGSVLFACNLNAVRSPMAELIAKHLSGKRIFVDSVGVRASHDEADPFAVAAMDEIGLDMSRHRPKSFDQLEDASFDLIVSLTPEAHHKALEMTRTMACDVEYWPTIDPTFIEGNRETILDGYRKLRDFLMESIKKRLDVAPPASL